MLRRLTAGAVALTALACSGDSVTPVTRRPPPATAPEVDAGRRVSVGLRRVGDSCDAAHACDEPANALCLTEIDPVPAVAGLLDIAIDGFVPPDEDAGVLDLLDIHVLRVPAPGGYCSASCTRDDQCGGGLCLSSEAAALAAGWIEQGAELGGFLAAPGICLEPCDRTADCRVEEGYQCRSAFQNAILINGIAGLPLDRPFFCLPPPPPP